VEREWTPSLLDRLVRMDTWAGNYSLREEMPDASEGEILRTGRQRWYRERNNRLAMLFIAAANVIGWIGAGVCFALGFVWSPFFTVAAVLFGGWLILYFVVMAWARVDRGQRRAQPVRLREIRRKVG
jgi:hypothetical protein